ncbi:hypothetical protein PR048_020369, partial [Dryococelus australis]
MKATEVNYAELDSRRDSSRLFSRGTQAGPCRCSVGFLDYFPFAHLFAFRHRSTLTSPLFVGQKIRFRSSLTEFAGEDDTYMRHCLHGHAILKYAPLPNHGRTSNEDASALYRRVRRRKGGLFSSRRQPEDVPKSQKDDDVLTAVVSLQTNLRHRARFPTASSLIGHAINAWFPIGPDQCITRFAVAYNKVLGFKNNFTLSNAKSNSKGRAHLPLAPSASFFGQPLLTTRLSPRRTGFDSRRSCSQISACGNRAGQCRWLADFLGDLPFPPPLRSGAAPYLPRFTLADSQDLDVKSHPDLFTDSLLVQKVAQERHLKRRECHGWVPGQPSCFDTCLPPLRHSGGKIRLGKIHLLHRPTSKLAGSQSCTNGPLQAGCLPRGRPWGRILGFYGAEGSCLTTANIYRGSAMVRRHSGGAQAPDCFFRLSSHLAVETMLKGCTRRKSMSFIYLLSFVPYRVQFPVGSLPDFRKWESYWVTPLVGGFSRGSSFSPALEFWRCSILTFIQSHQLLRPRFKEPHSFLHTLSFVIIYCMHGTQNNVSVLQHIYFCRLKQAHSQVRLVFIGGREAGHAYRHSGTLTDTRRYSWRVLNGQENADVRSPVSTVHSFRRCSILSSISPFGSQDLA